MGQLVVVKNIEEAMFVTHAGSFHADDAMGAVILMKVYGYSTVCRVSKVPENLPKDVIVFDIGKGKFDHHQKGGNGMRWNGVPYAAAGLLWREYGRQILKERCPEELIEYAWSLVDRDLIQGIDAVDTGKMPKAAYPAQALNISGIIAGFNPKWDDLDQDSDIAFERSVRFVTDIFENVLSGVVAKAKAKYVVDEAIESTDGPIMVLERFAPWQEFIFSSSQEKASEIQFVVFPSNRGGYNWQCVPDSLGGSGQRKPVPAEWRGLNAAELRKVTGVATANFCHPTGFIGGAETLKDAILMARIAAEA